MKITPATIKDVLIIEPKVFEDSRGFFMETYHRNRYKKQGIDRPFVQDNLSYSVKDTVRGLHFQVRHPQAKLVQVIAGEIFDVAVDIRKGSPTFGQWIGIHLSDQNKRQVFIPEGFAHGFCVISDAALFSYKCSDFYSADDELGILWADPDIAVDWPVTAPIISKKDKHLPQLSDLSHDLLPVANQDMS
jgi:dTDP-4-dehydrorhamnose 3,5-epimerase